MRCWITVILAALYLTEANAKTGYASLTKVKSCSSSSQSSTSSHKSVCSSKTVKFSIHGNSLSSRRPIATASASSGKTPSSATSARLNPPSASSPAASTWVTFSRSIAITGKSGISVSRSTSERLSSSSLLRTRAIGSSGCVVTILTTASATTYPVATITTYVSTAILINGDDFRTTLSKTPAIVRITNDYTTFVSSTLTTTTTSVPQSFVGVTASITESVPQGFIPVQSSLPNATYIQGRFGADPFAKHKVREVFDSASSGILLSASCKTITSTSTLYSTGSTRVSFITDTTPAIVYGYPVEGFTLYNPTGTALPDTVTQVVATPTTIYAATETSTFTVTQPTATKTFYAACATNNFADYIKSEDDTLNPIRYATTSRDIDFSFDISSDNLQTAYDCCAYAISNTASAWLFYGPGDLCVALYPQSLAKHTCLTQGSSGAQFEAVTGNKTSRVVGNGYCGQFSSSYFSAQLAN